LGGGHFSTAAPARNPLGLFYRRLVGFPRFSLAAALVVFRSIGLSQYGDLHLGQITGKSVVERGRQMCSQREH